MSDPTADRIDAYRAAWYRVDHPDGSETVRIGAPTPPRVQAWIASLSVPGAAFLTACNPFGERVGDAANGEAMARLRALVAARGWPCLGGEGGDDGGTWRPEPSLLIGLDSELQAARLGRAFRQDALVWVPASGAARLVVLRD